MGLDRIHRLDQTAVRTPHRSADSAHEGLRYGPPRATGRKKGLRDGALELVEVDEPAAPPGYALVRVASSVISAGTERATLEAAEKNLLAKARARPDQGAR